MYSYFAYLNRMKHIERWSLMHSNFRENIAEHSQQTAVIAHTLGVLNNIVFDGKVDAERLACHALYHEASEVLTGDLPTPIKYGNPAINKAYKDLESVACDKLSTFLPPVLQDKYKALMSVPEDAYAAKLLKAADKLSALIKCTDEIKSGNREFCKAKISIEKELAAYSLPEADYFSEHFLPAVALSLDELEQ